MHGVRARTSIGAVLAVALVLVLSGVALVLFLRSSLTHDIQRVAEIRASSVDGLILDNTLPRRIAIANLEDEFVQVLDGSGSAVAASSNLSGVAPLIRLPEQPDVVRLEVPFEDDPFLAVITPTEVPNQTYWIVSGQSLEHVTESIDAVIGLLVVGLPIVLLMVGFITWQISGRTLAPVNAITEEVRSISSEDLHRRVPEPLGEDEIAKLARTMNEMLARLEQSHLRQRAFVSDASHELRSPVAAIRQHLEVALAHPEQTSEGLVQVLLSEGLRMQSLIEDLLLLASIEDGSAAPTPTEVDLDDIVFAEADRVRAAASVEVDTGNVSAGRVKGHDKQLQRLVANVIANAARHARTKVAIHLKESDADVVLDVDDDGPGVPEAERRRIFERFVRLDEARARDAGGSGLGLSIAGDVATAHGGRIEVLSSPLGGARFRITLPIA